MTRRRSARSRAGREPEGASASSSEGSRKLRFRQSYVRQGAGAVEFHLKRKELVMHGNAELLRRAVENVVRNALHHATGSNRIEILLDEPGARELVLLRVRDRGQGIGEDEIQSLFEPFKRGRTSRGFGLGLAIAQRAVAVHKGSISAANLSEGGVEVRIALPLEAVGPNCSESAAK